MTRQLQVHPAKLNRCIPGFAGLTLLAKIGGTLPANRTGRGDQETTSVSAAGSVGWPSVSIIYMVPGMRVDTFSFTGLQDNFLQEHAVVLEDDPSLN